MQDKLKQAQIAHAVTQALVIFV